MKALMFVFFLLIPFTAHAETPWWRLTTASNVSSTLTSTTKEESLKIPILIGVKPGDFKDTYGKIYTSGSIHQGEDIFASRGAYVISPTKAVVTRVDTKGAGGIAVYTANPGDETFYFAHMTAVGPLVKVGAVLEPGDLIGYVGNTGAESSSSHLHFQIFDLNGPINPFPRLVTTFSDQERMSALGRIIDNSGDSALAASAIVKLYGAYLRSQPIDTLPTALKTALTGSIPTTQPPTPTVTLAPQTSQSQPTTPTVAPPASTGDVLLTQNLRAGARNDDVKKLQAYLIDKKAGIYGETLKDYGATGYYGKLTALAVAEFQKSVGIVPASGYCGPATRAYINTHR